MTYSAIAMANAIIVQANHRPCHDLTPMKLQRLLWWGHALSWSDAHRPWIDDTFCRWKHGPVVPSLYHRLKMWGDRPIERPIVTARHGSTHSLRVPMVPLDDYATHGEVLSVLARWDQTPGDRLSAWTLPWLPHVHGEADGRPLTVDDAIDSVRRWRESSRQSDDNPQAPAKAASVIIDAVSPGSSSVF